MKIKKYIMTVVLLLMSSTMMLSAQNKDEVFVHFQNDLKQKAVEISSITCDFIQIRSMSVLVSEVRKEGKFYYERPERILLLFDDGDFIRMTENAFQMKNAGHVSQTRINSNPMLKELKRMLTACMTGDVTDLRKSFSISVQETEALYLLDLTPVKNKKSAGMSRIFLHFDRKDMSLVQLKMEESSGDYTLYEFKGKRFNQDLDETLFSVD